MLRLAKRVRPSLRVVDFAVDLKLVEDAGGRTRLFVGMARFIAALSLLIAHFRAKPSKRWCPSQTTPWIKFEVDAKSMRVRLEVGMREKGISLFIRSAAAPTGGDYLAREILKRGLPELRGVVDPWQFLSPT